MLIYFIFIYLFVYLFVYLFIYLYMYNKLQTGFKDLVENWQI